MAKKFFYARVSTKEQKLDRQIDLFKELGADERVIFAEKQSGKNFENREAWQELMEKWVEPGDTIVIKNFDRLGRNKKEVKDVMISLARRQIFIESIDQAYLNKYLRENMVGNKEKESFSEVMEELFFQILLDIDLYKAEWERKEIAKRRDEGIKSAKKRGVKFGRPLNEKARENFLKLYPLTRNKDNFESYRTVVSVVKELGISRSQFYLLEKKLIKNNCI